MTSPSSASGQRRSTVRLVRFLAFRLVRLFYSTIDVHGRDHLAGDGPVLFVLNHPNGLLDPVLLMIALDRPAAFLAKSTFFGNPLGQWVMEAFGALPVFRRRDEGLRGGPKDEGDVAAGNEETFARCRALLRDGQAMALFPEGTTHSEPELLPLRTGAARIALSSEAEAGWALNLRIVPVGLWYEEKTRFRSSVLLVVGEPFVLTAYREAYAEDERQAVQAVTDRIEAGLDAVVLQAENAELLTAIPVVAAWTVPAGEGAATHRHTWAATLLATYNKLYHTDPERLERIAEKARRYAALLQALGISDPWRLEDPAINRRYLARRVAGLALTALPALAGFVMSYGPYRLTGVIAGRVDRRDRSLTGTIKLIAGSLFVLAGWIIEAVVVGFLFGPWWGGGVFVIAPVLAYTALRWGEGRRALRELASYQWLRERRGGLVALLADRRQTLARDVVQAVEAVA